MQKLAELNSEITKTISLNIVCNESIQNFRYNNNWVTDLHPSYFEKKIKKLEKLFDKNINYDNENHIKYLKVMYQEVIDTYKKQAKNDYSKLSLFGYDKNYWNYELDYPKKAPQNFSWVLTERLDSGRQEYINEGVKGFYDINDESISYEELTTILIDKHNVSEDDLDFIFAKSNFSYIIWLHLQMVIKILDKIKNLLAVVEKLETFSNTKIETKNKEEVLNTSKLIFNCRKYEIAYIFKFLYDYGYIDGSERARDSEEYLKNFLNENNTYYFSREKLKKIEKMTNEFTRLGKHAENHITKEIKFSEQYIENLHKRIEYLKTID